MTDPVQARSEAEDSNQAMSGIKTYRPSPARPPGSLLIGLFVILFTATVDNQLLIPLLPRLSLDLTTRVSTLGLLFSVYALAATASNLLLGPLSDRRGRIGFLRVGILLLAATSIATQWCQSFWQLLLVRATAGIAGGLVSVCTASLVGDWFSYRTRGRAVGILLSAHFTALILGIPISVQIAELFHWRRGFLGVSLLAGVALLFSYFSFPSRSREECRRTLRGPIRSPQGSGSYTLDPGDHGSGSMVQLYRAFWRDVEMRGALIVSFLTSGATLAFLAYISGLGLSTGQITWLFMITGVASILGAPAAGWLSDRLSKRLVFLVGNTLLVVPLIFLASAAWGGRLFWLFFSLMLLAAARQTALQAVQTELAGAARRGAFLGLRNGFAQLGIACCVAAAAYLLEVRGFPGVVAFTIGLTLAATLVFFLFVPEPGSA